jgi:tripartite-type tricarboxylate transporter receptor subunit TctC
MVVPFAAGGGTDIVARLIAQHAAVYLGQAFIVENRAGAGGSLGSDAVAKSSADGHTLLMATVSTHAINPALYLRLPFDPIASFAPISLVARVGGVVAVNAAVPANTLRELADGMRKEPARYSFGSQGVGGIGHLMGEMFNTLAGTKAVHVPYKGAAPALQDLIAGNIQILYDTVPALLPHIQSGAIRALAVTTPKRTAALPQIPTTAEAGFPDFLASTWNAILAPAGTPADVIEVLNKAIVKAVHEPSVRGRMADLSAEPVGSSPAELLSFMKQELQTWAPVVKASGARAE